MKWVSGISILRNSSATNCDEEGKEDFQQRRICRIFIGALNVKTGERS